MAEHRSAQCYAWLGEGRLGDVFYDVGLSVVLKPGYEPFDMLWVFDSKPRSATGHRGVSLAWGGRMDRIELPPVVREELERIGLDEIVADVAWLPVKVYSGDMEPGSLVAVRCTARPAEQIQ